MPKVGIKIDEDREINRPFKTFTKEDIDLVISSLRGELESDYLGKSFLPNDNLFIHIKVSF